MIKSQIGSNIVITVVFVIMIVVIVSAMKYKVWYEKEYPCIEYETRCYNEHTHYIPAGKTMMITTDKTFVSCDDPHEKQAQYCIKREGVEDD